MASGAFARSLLLPVLLLHGVVSLRTETEENTTSNASEHGNSSSAVPVGQLGLESFDIGPGKHGHLTSSEQTWRRILVEQRRPKSATEILLAIGGGTGAGAGSGNATLDAEILQRMQYQDRVVLVLLLAAYFVALIFSATLIHRQATNASPIIYYADPRYSDAVVDSNDLDEYLEAFNQPPTDVQLHVRGLVPLPGLLPHVVDDSVELWQGLYYRYAFSFSLDLTPWIVAEDGEAGDVRNGMPEDDLKTLAEFLETNSNDLGRVQIRKTVSWHAWEELAMNIKHKIRQSGFTGVLQVNFKQNDVMSVYKNTPWANFLHMSSTKILCGLSIFGYILYFPYMWFRVSGPVLRSNFKIDIDVDSYWELVGNKLSAE
eukprot:CAMPEP_0197665950 /NCGR_PEP_ID=MMETSP1338-20131121/60977_1 /TAXON_ID=43686 ORGANISM="Pelagodinium beii, Strain RCC1491" /NCGR_SAMPLE_ID=MMETSP1338 /ASSEMBLY_ACC=CAM_ASM_000754 /LENGTH=372 /DNA_ID=CAMNT_0043244891 /DNA_START=97 /DNA_END=1212 /DNA_ORIENTATION=+